MAENLDFCAKMNGLQMRVGFFKYVLPSLASGQIILAGFSPG